MGTELTADELDAFLGATPVGALATLRRDGSPVVLPMWFAWEGGRFWFRTPPSSRKLERLARDGRASFLVEAGEAWMSLRAARFLGTIMVEAREAARERALALLAAKYRDLEPDLERLPRAAAAYYRSSTVVLRFDPDGPPLSWDNAKIRLREPGPGGG